MAIFWWNILISLLSLTFHFLKYFSIWFFLDKEIEIIPRIACNILGNWNKNTTNLDSPAISLLDHNLEKFVSLSLFISWKKPNIIFNSLPRMKSSLLGESEPTFSVHWLFLCSKSFVRPSWRWWWWWWPSWRAHPAGWSWWWSSWRAHPALVQMSTEVPGIDGL